MLYRSNISLTAAFLLCCSCAWQPIAAQGAVIAEDIRQYIQAKTEEKAMEADAGRVPPTKQHSVGGQAIDEANSTVFKAFRMHPEWQSVVLVADWTASMYPYIGQVLAWHQVNADKKLVSDMILFNDGDDVLYPNRSKTIGKTGGIYRVNPNDAQMLFQTIEQATDNGDGGDSEENDLEALLTAQQYHPNAPYLILIADGSSVRDMSLLPQLRKPIHIILCSEGWLMDYVQMAYATGGSITLLSDHIDFSDKSKIDKNNIKLSGIRYSIP